MDVDKAQHWDSKGHFFTAAAGAMCRIVVEQARRKRRVRHGGGKQRVDLDEACSFVEPQADGLLAFDEALTRLASLNPIRAEVVKLRFFTGLTMALLAPVSHVNRPNLRLKPMSKAFRSKDSGSLTRGIVFKLKGGSPSWTLAMSVPGFIFIRPPNGSFAW